MSWGEPRYRADLQTLLESATVSHRARLVYSRPLVGRGGPMAQGLAIAATCSCIVAGCLFVADGQAQAQRISQRSPAQVTPIEAAPLSAIQEKGLKPKDTFKECANCPEMMVVPAGSFT